MLRGPPVISEVTKWNYQGFSFLVNTLKDLVASFIVDSIKCYATSFIAEILNNPVANFIVSIMSDNFTRADAQRLFNEIHQRELP